MDYLKELPGVIAVVISIIGVYLQYRKARLDERKGDTEMVKTLQSSALELIKPYQDEVIRLRREVADSHLLLESMKDDIVTLRNKLDLVIQERNAIWNGAKVLHFQVKSVGVEPVYTPPESVVELTGTFKRDESSLSEIKQREIDKLLDK